MITYFFRMDKQILQQRIRSGFWYTIFPVRKKEKNNVMILCFFKFLFSIAYTLLKLQKKNIITVDHDAKQVPYVESFVFPITLVIISLYTMLSNRVSPKKLFYSIIFFFLGFLSLYAFVLVPFHASLTPDITHLQLYWQGYPSVQNYLLVYKYWIKTIFFCVSELFAQFFIILFFWGIANELFNREQAKRLYHLLIIAGCVGSLIASMGKYVLGKYIEKNKSDEMIRKTSEMIVYNNTRIISYIVILILLMVLFLYNWIVSQPGVMVENRQLNVHAKNTMSFFQSLKHIINNRYLLMATLLIVSCAVATTLIDTTYENYIKINAKKIPTNHDFWHSSSLVCVNILCIVAGILLTQGISRKFSWKWNAYITPITVMVLGIPFFVELYLS